MPNEQPDRQRTSATPPRAELIADAVIMAYIHEISVRHRPTSPVAARAAEVAA